MEIEQVEQIVFIIITIGSVVGVLISLISILIAGDFFRKKRKYVEEKIPDISGCRETLSGSWE